MKPSSRPALRPLGGDEPALRERWREAAST